MIGCILKTSLGVSQVLLFVSLFPKLESLPVYNQNTSSSIYLHAQQETLPPLFPLSFKAICFSILAYKKNRTIFFNVNRDLQGNKSVKKRISICLVVKLLSFVSESSACLEGLPNVSYSIHRRDLIG